MDSNPKPKVKPTILILMPEHKKDCKILEDFLPNSEYLTIKVDNKIQAEKLIKYNRVDVVLCEACIPDGDWKDILKVIQDHEKSPKLVVCSKQADEFLWCEVLNMGGHDVLSKPFEEDEVKRVVQIASTPFDPK